MLPLLELTALEKPIASAFVGPLFFQFVAAGVYVLVFEGRKACCLELAFWVYANRALLTTERGQALQIHTFFLLPKDFQRILTSGINSACKCRQ